jgi:adenine-specific DNA-methyltransferase
LADSYESYTKDELIRLLRERDRRRAFGLVWERDRIEHDRSVNGDFVGLEPDAALSNARCRPV